MKRLRLLLLCLFVLAAISVSAQSYNPLQTGDVQQQVSADVVPQYPKSGDTVNISLSAYGTSLDSSTITWSVDGKTAQSGTGITKFSMTAGSNGQSSKVVALIQPPNQPSITKTFTISPQEVSIIYEADSYTPPFYKGKGLFNKEGKVRFVAMPNLVSSGGVHLNPNSLIYKWSVDGTVQGSLSGYGKTSLPYTADILGNSVTIQVEVSSVDGTVKGTGIMVSSPQPSIVLVYENNPIYGLMFNKELSSNQLFLKDKEVTVKASPYFSSAPKSTFSDLQYAWSINGVSVPAPSGQDHVILRNSTGQNGTSIIGVSVQNSTHLLQIMSNSLSINF